MITKIFEIITKTGKAEKDLKKVSDGVEKVNEGLETTNKETKKLGLLGKGFGAAKKGAKGLGNGIKSITKAAGVFTLIALALGKLKELFEQNQKVVDIFNIAFESLAIAFNDFFTYINDNISTVTGFFKSLFTDPITKIKEFGNAIYDGIVVRIKQGLEALGLFGKAVGKLFSGDFKGAMETAKEATKELFDVVTGEEGGFEVVKESVKNATTAITEYTKSTVSAATANIELKKSAELAAVANQGLIEKYDLQAESLRQIRDDERNSIADRKKANDELAIVLEQQEAAMLSNAQISLKAAKAELQKDKNNIEFKKAVMEAENELVAVRAQVAGFRSEQQANDLALSKEEMEMTKSKLESEANLSIEQKRFNAEQIEDNLQRLEKQKEIDAQEREIQTTRLQGIVNDANAGTQAKIDAQIALNEFNQQADQQEVTRLSEIEAEKLRIKTEADAETEILNQKKIDDAQTVADAEKAIQDAQFSNIESGLSLVKDLAGDNKKIQAAALIAENAVGVAKTIINTQAANAAALATPQAILTSGAAAIPVIAANNIAAGISIATSVAATAKGLSALKAGGSPTSATTPSTSGGGTSAPSIPSSPSQAPSFNVVGQSGFNQVAGALSGQQPVQAFVVSGDVTTAQQLQNNTITQATF
jgi:hypothetical protein